MNTGNQWKLLGAATLLVSFIVAVSCTRQIAIPVSPSFPTSTPIVVGTPATAPFAAGPSSPANSTQVAGASNLPVVQVLVSNSGTVPITITSLTITDSGTGNASTGITNITLTNTVASLGTTTISGTTATFNGLTVVIAPSSSVTIQANVNFSGTAPAGTYQFSITAGAGTNGQAVNFSGLPYNGAMITIAAATATATNSPTNSPSATSTNTSTGPTSTPTNSPTVTVTNTPSSTATQTPSNSPSNTATPSPTVTITPTPTTNPDTIADFEAGQMQDNPINGLTGYWYSVVSAGSSATTALVSVGATGCASGNFVSIGGTVGSTAPTYAQLQADFVNPTGAYNITTNAPALTNAFTFCIKSTQTTQVWFSVSDASTTQSSANAGFYINGITPAWQTFTVCFNHMQSPNWAPASIAGHLFDPTSAISASWQVTAASANYDLEVDNFQFAQVGGGPCPSFTPTPTPNPILIDDFEATGGSPNDFTNINTEQDSNGHWRDGSWFSYVAPDLTTGVTNFSAAGNPGSAVEFSGNIVAQSSYSGVGFTFTNPAGTHNAGVSYYDATVSGYTGIRFDAMYLNKSVTNCLNNEAINVDLVDITSTGTVTDHKIAVPLTNAWQGVTVFYNQVLGPSNVALVPVSMYQVQFQPLSNGVANYTYDFAVDNIQFVTGGPGVQRVARGATVVDDMTNGSNQINFTTGGSTPGYLYDYMGAGSMCPYNQAFFLGSPGHLAQDIQGIPSMAIHYSGTVAAASYGGCGFWFTDSNVMTNISAYTQLVFYAKSSLSNSFTITFNDLQTNGCYGNSVNTYSSLAVGPAWAPMTLTYGPSNGAYQFGTASGVNGTNGCTTTGAAWGPVQFDPTAAANIQFEPSPGNYDLWLDNLYLQ